ncbi:antigen identified by monoclonal antibody Ki-67 [Sorochytrium milnesiophthora]
MLLLLPPRSRTPPKSAPSTTALASRLVFVPPNDDNNTNNNRQERILRFTKHTIAVGRDDDQDLRIKCDLISRNHLAIHIDPVLLEARLRLLGVNPIELNGRTITPSDSSDAWHALHHGDCISFLTKKNKKTFRFELELPSDHVGLHRRPSPPDHTLPSSPLSSLSSLSPQSSPLSGNNNNTPPPRPRSANSKSVSFGPPLRPQIFDKDCPSLHTLSRGESPHSPCPLSPSASSPLSTTTTKTPRSILRKPLSTSTTIKRPTPFFTKANRHPLSISTTRTLPAVAATDPSDTYPLSYLRDLVRKAKLPKQNVRDGALRNTLDTDRSRIDTSHNRAGIRRTDTNGGDH